MDNLGNLPLYFFFSGGSSSWYRLLGTALINYKPGGILNCIVPG